MGFSNKENFMEKTIEVLKEIKPSSKTSMILQKRNGNIVRFTQKTVKDNTKIQFANQHPSQRSNFNRKLYDKEFLDSNFHKLKKEAEKLDVDDDLIQRFSTLVNPIPSSLNRNTCQFLDNKKETSRKILIGRPVINRRVRSINKRLTDFNEEYRKIQEMRRGRSKSILRKKYICKGQKLKTADSSQLRTSKCDKEVFTQTQY